MNRARWKEIDDQFRQALDLPEGQRTRFVLELQVRNPELGSAVKELLASAGEAEAVLGESAAVFAGPMLAALSSDEWDALHPGAIIGGYRLLREIGRSGPSTVYLAEPAKARFGTRVAIKVMARSADAGEVIGRILHERETLAGLDHPGIARFHDGGATASGLPYIIIELVDGQPLLAWCDEQRLDTSARLGVFLQVCDAVQHAHQQFVAHRDLGPSRILVSDRGTAKIMEFGIARVLQSGPVSTADDVHALGAILWQLLTGQVPRLPDEPRRSIVPTRAAPPARARASEVAREGGDAVSRARGTSPSGLAARLRGDLDAIAAKALDQDATAQYQSAGALADDIRRHLQHRPVRARPSSAAYRASRFVQRHRTRLGIAALVALVFAAAAGTTGFHLTRDESLTTASMPATTATSPRTDPTPVPGSAVAQAAAPVGVVDSTTTPAPAAVVQQPIAAPSPVVQPPVLPPTVVQPVTTERVEQRAIASTGNDQRTAAPARSVSPGRTVASTTPRRSMADSLAWLGQQAGAMRKAGRNAEAEAALRQLLVLQQANGAESLDVALQQWELGDLLRVMHRYDEAEALLRSSLQTRQRMASGDGAEVGQSLAGLAMVQCEQGRTGESDSLFKQAISIYRRLPADAGGLRMPETDRAQCR